MAWSQLIKEVEGTELCYHSEVVITRLGYDSRLISLWEGLLFIALKSARTDGHDFIPELYARGVRCFVVGPLRPVLSPAEGVTEHLSLRQRNYVVRRENRSNHNGEFTRPITCPLATNLHLA